jgi:hypothetical protein
VQETLYRSILRYRDTAHRQLRAQFELLSTLGELRPALQSGTLPSGTLKSAATEAASLKAHMEQSDANTLPATTLLSTTPPANTTQP